MVIDCTPSGVGIANKNEFYSKFTHNTRGFIAQGSEYGFGKMYARGVNDAALIPGEDQFLQVVSCNTHNLAVLIQTLAIAVKLKATKAQIDQTIAIHPTAAEEFVTMRTRARVAIAPAKAAE